MKAPTRLLPLLLVVVLLPVPTPSWARTVPHTSCSVFPANNVWHMNVSALPVNAKNGTWKRAMHAGSALLHPDFGHSPYGLPFTVTSSSTPTARIRFTYASESDRVRYPFTANTPIEQGSDRHALMIDRDTCTLYELFDARWNGGSPTAGSGAVFHLGSNALRPSGWTSADAAGLPILPGLVRYDEVRAGRIGHAIRFTVACTRNRFIWPARHRAGIANASCPPMGARFRLKAGYDIGRFGAQARVVLIAMKRFGMIVADNGSDWYFQGATSSRWPNRLLDQLKRVPASAFQAVDESGCRVDPDSGRFAYGPRCPAPA